VGARSWLTANSSWAGQEVLSSGKPGGQESRLGPREDAAWHSVTNCGIILKVGGLGCAWVNWEATGHAK